MIPDSWRPTLVALLARHELKRQALHAVTQTGRSRSVIEDMAQVTLTTGADILGAVPAKFVIRHIKHVTFLDWLPKTRPTGAGLVFGFGIEQRKLARGAYKGPFALLVEEGTGERAFGACLAENMKLFGGKPRPPLCDGFLHGFDTRRGLGRGFSVAGPGRAACRRQQSHQEKEFSNELHVNESEWK